MSRGIPPAEIVLRDGSERSARPALGKPIAALVRPMSCSGFAGVSFRDPCTSVQAMDSARTLDGRS